ncbi:L,D-transpeptidase family protein [Sphingomonas glaciei]|uniref:L,D-transpeptidase family protein n=1 Tax=Sphingomonas glaciei TaxID=2938948 RepID=A0ABY5MSN5_9SPHN|nr:L,D-transpeptidase family protein [Sphingomonas glaciei]UUR06951.1 L,D-transpeptidase family protein [Sphingomonas glaciei]
MRWLFLTLAAASAGGLYASQYPAHPKAPVMAAAKARTNSPPVAPLTDKKRLILTPQQQREASADGGFRQVPKSLLRIDRRMHYGEFEWDEAGVPPGPITVRVDLRTQLMSVFRGGHEIGTAVALYGADSKQTPLGSFPILWKGRNHRSSLYDAPMPFTLRLTGDGVAIHGSNVRWGAATHGCVGVPTEFAERLFAEAKVGDIVTIVRSASAAAKATS